VKLRNIHDFVDVFQSSKQRKQIEEKLELERRMEEQELLQQQNNEEETIPDF